MLKLAILRKRLVYLMRLPETDRVKNEIKVVKNKIQEIKNNHLKWPWIEYSNAYFYLILLGINIFYLFVL